MRPLLVYLLEYTIQSAGHAAATQGLGCAHHQEARHHGVAEDDGLQLALGARGVAVLPGQHVHLALVHPQLTDVRLRVAPNCYEWLQWSYSRNVAVIGPPFIFNTLI